jgi:hypothetical protein
LVATCDCPQRPIVTLIFKTLVLPVAHEKIEIGCVVARAFEAARPSGDKRAVATSVVMMRAIAPTDNHRVARTRQY